MYLCLNHQFPHLVSISYELHQKYEFCLSTTKPQLGWVRGPKPAGSESDITMFRGGNEEDGQENWDKEALYFKIPDGK